MPENLVRFHEIWTELRAQNDGEIPFRQQIGLRELRGLTANLMVYELTGPKELFVKMSGTALDAQFGRNLTGLSVYDVAEMPAADAFVTFHEALIRHPCAGYAADILVAKNGKRLRADYLILPVRNRFGEVVQCATMSELATEGYGLPPGGDDSMRVTYHELIDARHLDIGFGLPDYEYTIINDPLEDK
jgi:hypothetical protein